MKESKKNEKENESKKVRTNVDYCIMCGEYIPEGDYICKKCKEKLK